jgi:large subunit ribosomal protein L17
MRHGKKFNHLGRKVGHRKALLKNMSIALVKHKRIFTTLAKAKALRKHIEPLITKSKTNTTHSRRVLFSYLQDKESVKELFDVIAPKIGERPGGYVRVIRTGFRQSDAAEMAMIEFVDFNDVYTGGGKKDKAATEGTKKKRTRRGRSSKAKAAVATAAVLGSSEEE